MNLDQLYKKIKADFPSLSTTAETIYTNRWNDIIETDFSPHAWFESLANAVNSEMNRQVPSKNYKNLFILISKEYSAGEQDTKTAIDVAFIENLFWQVSNNDAKSYWDILPMNLKNLYVGFHGRSPL